MLNKKPWGWFFTLFKTKRFWLKFLNVKGSTSYQSHKERTEYVFGFYKVKPNVKHRMTQGFYIELATGLPREEDIIRYEDDYNR